LWVPVRREVFYSTIIEFGMPMKLVRLMKMCLDETYIKVCICKNVSGAFPIQNGLKQGTLYHHCFRICHQEGPRISRGWELNGTHLLVSADDVNNHHKEKHMLSLRLVGRLGRLVWK